MDESEILRRLKLIYDLILDDQIEDAKDELMMIINTIENDN